MSFFQIFQKGGWWMHGFCQVLDKPLGKSGEYSQNCLANFGEPGESQHFSCFGHFALADLLICNTRQIMKNLFFCTWSDCRLVGGEGRFLLDFCKLSLGFPHQLSQISISQMIYVLAILAKFDKCFEVIFGLCVDFGEYSQNCFASLLSQSAKWKILASTHIH